MWPTTVSYPVLTTTPMPVPATTDEQQNSTFGALIKFNFCSLVALLSNT